ncbi:DUF2953 domain-containing protein [Clostridium sp.]|uniref:DUF2953 domain-containing protein n=1 Tax=Clostridium sp. TaxID=1506 RepID=UPI001A4B6968|nr:DUF2953 domain-containing protein [Clostridium sp.]MBK5240744.1 DUF2953 domain-containing protein [Clostridium sp.]
MFVSILVFVIALTIILFPIPIKITLKYSKKILEIFIYNKKLKAKKSKKNNPAKKQKITTEKSYTFIDIKLIINKIMSLKFKPTLTLTTKLEYGFDDAALVAILFGLIHSTYSLLYLLLLNFVKIKNIDHKVIPYFKEKNLSIEISSIIYTNLAKIIYMSILMLICLKSINIRHKKINSQKYKGGNVHG